MNSGFVCRQMQLLPSLKRLMTFSIKQLEHKKFLLDDSYSQNEMNWMFILC